MGHPFTFEIEPFELSTGHFGESDFLEGKDEYDMHFAVTGETISSDWDKTHDKLLEETLGSSTLPTGRVLTYTQKDVIDNRISVPAQHSLVRLSKTPATSFDAVGMLEAIKSGQLAGINCVNWERAAKRAVRLGQTWGTAIPKGEDAVLMLDPDNPSNGPPLIAFRRELDPRKDGCGTLKSDAVLNPSPYRLDAALIRAWRAYSRFRSRDIVPCDVAGDAAVTPSGEPTVPPTCRVASRPPIPPWIQLCLNRTLALNLPITGILDAQTRSALRSFRQRRGTYASETEVGRNNTGLDSTTVQLLRDACGQPGGPPSTTIFEDPGDWWSSNVALQNAIEVIRRNRTKIELRFLVPVGAGWMYTAATERAGIAFNRRPRLQATDKQKHLAADYLAWLNQNNMTPTFRYVPDKRNTAMLNLWHDLQTEGDPSSINTYDRMLLTWGRGFAGGTSLEKVIKKLFAKSRSARLAFLFNGIGLKDIAINGSQKTILTVVDTNQTVILEDSPSQARNYIRNDERLRSLFINIAQGVGQTDQNDARQALLDAQFETLGGIPSGNLPTQVFSNWDREAIAVAGHNIHAGGPYTWDVFKNLRADSTGGYLRGVVATIGIKSGRRLTDGTTIANREVTFRRLWTYGRGYARSALMGPYAILGPGDFINHYSQDEMIDPPSEFGMGKPAWQPDWIYFLAPYRDEKAHSLREKHKHRGQRKLTICYLAKKAWAAGAKV